MKKAILAGAALTLLVAGIVRVELVAQAPPDGDASTTESRSVNSERAAKRKAMVEAATRTYQAVTASYEAGTERLDGLFVWSSHIRLASIRAADTNQQVEKACREHLDRMRNVHAKVKVLYDEQAKGGEADKRHATEFYVAEAELLLLEAKNGTNGSNKH